MAAGHHTTSRLTIASMLLRAVERHPDREAIVYGGRRCTYAEWNARVNRTAHALAELGVRPYDRVALLMHANEAIVTLYFACQKLGAVAVPMNFRLSTGEVAHVLQDSGARLLAYEGSLAETALSAAGRVKGLSGFIVVESNASEAGHHDYEALAGSGSSHDPIITADVTPEMLSAVVYTSGTTGLAKGVMHTHANDIAIAMNCALEYQLGPEDRALHIAPLYHVGGMQAFFVPHVLVGATNVIQSRYEPRRALQAIQGERATTLFAVPTQIAAMLTHPEFEAFDVSSLQMITTGGATLAATTMERVLNGFCPRLYNGYGLTEASLTLLMNPRDSLRKLGSCGKATLLSETRIVVHDPSRDVLPDEEVVGEDVGELIVRGPHSTPGYWNNPVESAERLRHGWLYTGDLFSRDSEGYHYFHGRADDMIVSGGENIYPSEVEDVLHRCPGVREAVVVGMPDSRWGSAVTAFVVRSNPALTEEDIDRFCRDSDLLAHFKRPRRTVFVEALPTNPSGKVLTRELIARFG
ncbi:MAG: AMP-binding protein [Thermoleophilaceae bacterium]|nr:AMP-binding protein [Thermoleophilaceae bacterium]